MDTLELLSDIARQVGPKERPLTYQDFLEETLRKSIKPKKAKAAVLNSIETDPVYDALAESEVIPGEEDVAEDDRDSGEDSYPDPF